MKTPITDTLPLTKREDTARLFHTTLLADESTYRTPEEASRSAVRHADALFTELEKTPEDQAVEKWFHNSRDLAINYLRDARSRLRGIFTKTADVDYLLSKAIGALGIEQEFGHRPVELEERAEYARLKAKFEPEGGE